MTISEYELLASDLKCHLRAIFGARTLTSESKQRLKRTMRAYLYRWTRMFPESQVSVDLDGPNRVMIIDRAQQAAARWNTNDSMGD